MNIIEHGQYIVFFGDVMLVLDKRSCLIYRAGLRNQRGGNRETMSIIVYGQYIVFFSDVLLVLDKRS